MLFLCQVLNTIKTCVCECREMWIFLNVSFQCQACRLQCRAISYMEKCLVPSWCNAVCMHHMWKKVSCHEKCLSCFNASHMEKVSIMSDALQFVRFTYIYIYGKGVCYATIHCNLHVLYAEKCPITSGCIAICMPHIWKMCLLCPNTLQFACITCRKVSCHIWMHCYLYASHMEKVCYVTVHCSLHALHTEKCPVTSGYIAICMPHIWKRCLLCHNTLQFACITYRSVLLCLDTLQFVCLTYGKSVRHVMHSNLHAVLSGIGAGGGGGGGAEEGGGGGVTVQNHQLGMWGCLGS